MHHRANLSYKREDYTCIFSSYSIKWCRYHCFKGDYYVGIFNEYFQSRSTYRLCRHDLFTRLISMQEKSQLFCLTNSLQHRLYHSIHLSGFLGGITSQRFLYDTCFHFILRRKIQKEHISLYTSHLFRSFFSYLLLAFRGTVVDRDTLVRRTMWRHIGYVVAQRQNHSYGTTILHIPHLDDQQHLLRFNRWRNIWIL